MQRGKFQCFNELGWPMDAKYMKAAAELALVYDSDKQLFDKLVNALNIAANQRGGSSCHPEHKKPKKSPNKRRKSRRRTRKRTKRRSARRSRKRR